VGESGFRRALLILGHGVFLALFVLAAQHAELRFLQADSAYQFVKWLAHDGVIIEAHRYTAIIPQLIVKALATIPVGLRALLLAASIAHVAVAYAVFVLCAHAWKAWRSAVGCALAAVLCSRLAFYSPVLEANYLLSFPFLLIGHIELRTGHPWTFPHILKALAFLLVTLVVHPAGWTIMLFATVFLFAVGLVPKRPLVLLCGLCLVWPILSRQLFPPTDYELGQYAAVAEGLRLVDQLFQWASWNFLRMHLFRASATYLPAVLVLLATVALWLQRKAWGPAILTVGGVAAYLLLYLVTFHRGDAGIMMDRGVLPVATIIALSMAWCIPSSASPAWNIVVVVALVLVSFFKLRDISFASRPFMQERGVLERLVVDARSRGLRKELRPREALVGTSYGWALPCSSLIQSSLAGPDHSVMIAEFSTNDTAPQLGVPTIRVLGEPLILRTASRRWFGE
jgi:hypothetical protein